MEDFMQVDGTLQLRDTLGKGGMGCVFRANHTLLGREVAVKVLSESALCPEACARLLREARLTARVESPYVVRVLDCRAPKGASPYIVMEKVCGADLSLRIRNNGKLPLSEVRTLVRQLSSALEAVHAAGVVHADVKPENVILDEDCSGTLRVKLIDFGVARSADEAPLYSDGFPAGTPSAMSPEQILEPRVAHPSWDAWGLAVLIYTALTGHVPYDGETLASVLYAASRGDRQSVCGFRDDVSPEVDRVFARALARSPGERYPSLAAFARALEAALDIGIDKSQQAADTVLPLLRRKLREPLAA